MRKRSDNNQSAIISDLRQLGASVMDLSGVGNGCPDLLIGWAGKTHLVEIKNPAGRGDRFTPDEKDFLNTWAGAPVILAHTSDDILNALGRT